MKSRDPLVSVRRSEAEIASLQRAILATKGRASREVKRLARNRHREDALRRLYWESDLFSAKELGRLFKLNTNDVSVHAGPLRVQTSCLICRGKFPCYVPTRTARAELEREKGASPRWRCCPACDLYRIESLARLRKRPGERLTQDHRDAYERYLRSDAWQERRLTALARADGRCQTCNGKKRLDVHHRTYDRIGREKASDLTVICRTCHELFHGH